MRIGLHALGIGAGARRDVLRTVAQGADATGLGTLWVGEHVVMVDEAISRYPYTDEGRIPIPADTDWLDPFVALTFAAAATERIGLATGVLLLPEHNPVVVAKQAASLDMLSGGRLVLGVGIGWSKEEFDALGVPFEGRGARLEESVAAMRVLWRDDVASFEGRFTSFEAVRVNPRPKKRRVPIVLGGNSDRALERVAALGDGWYGFNLTMAEVEERVGMLHRKCRERGRSSDEVTVAVAPLGCRPSDRSRMADLGVDEMVVVDSPPADAGAAAAWVAELAEAWLP